MAETFHLADVLTGAWAGGLEGTKIIEGNLFGLGEQGLDASGDTFVPDVVIGDCKIPQVLIGTDDRQFMIGEVVDDLVYLGHIGFYDPGDQVNFLLRPDGFECRPAQQ